MVHQCMIKSVVMWLHILVVSVMSHFNVNFNFDVILTVHRP